MRLLLLLLVLVLLLFSGCGNSEVVGDNDFVDNEVIDDAPGFSLSCDDVSITECEEETGISRGGCYSDYAEARLDPCLCDTIEENTQRGTCFEDIAIGLKDPTYCSSAYIKSKCYEEVAYVSGDESICDYAGGHAEQCHSFFEAAATVDTTCGVDTIASCEPDSDGFIASVTGQKCYVAVAKILGDPCVCLMSEGAFKINCIPAVAVQEEQVEFCLEVNEDFIFTDDQAIQKHGCITDVAIRMKDPSLCERSTWKAFGKGGPNACYDEYAQKLGDPTVCDNMVDGTYKSAEEMIANCKENAIAAQ